MQVGLFQIVGDLKPTYFKNTLISHGGIRKQFDIPAILTTSTQENLNGHLPREILDICPNTTRYPRPGEVNVWDNPDFPATLRGANKTQIIVAGILTGVCTELSAQSLRAGDLSVWINFEALH
ncbi:hypothetical protein BJ878DRAFT_281447 [Calycina marina]|uniref:Isochorismatase-like domain-containing protein n=1 Tax=Calycina marina TaxID=1763456 RepID=A0A9P7Z6F2_9HELO|nr:hypothetical protein BJ878DRAFT_281447 [Calycina marina]